MFQFSIDLGQVIIATLIAVTGWLLGNKLTLIDKRLEKHDNQIVEIWQFLTERHNGQR